MRPGNLLASCALALAATFCGSGVRAADIAAKSREAIGEDPAWQHYVLNVAGPYVTPKAVFVEGDRQGVLNADALIAPGRGSAVITTKAAQSARIVVDLGVLSSGFVELGVHSAHHAPIRVSYAEDRRNLGPEGDAPTDPTDFFYKGHTLGTDDDPDGRADLFDPPGQSAVLRSPGLRGSERYIAITLDGAGTVAIDFVRVRQTNYRGSYDGHFLSSDERLNHAWYASAYALNLSTIRDKRRNPAANWVIVDGPKRDRVPYLLDLELVAQAAYYQGSDYRRIVRDTIDLFACQQYPDGTFPAVSVIDAPCPRGDPGLPHGPLKGFGPPPPTGLVRLDSFSAAWVVFLAEYLQYTGDADFVRPLLPSARREVQFLEAHCPDGVLFRTENYGHKLAFNWHTPDKAQGVDAYTNVIFYRALRSLADLERTLGHDENAAAKLDERAEQVRSALFTRLWDPRAGAFLLNTDDPLRNHGADGNIGALASGMLDPQQARSVIHFLDTKLGTPFGTATGEFANDPYMTRYVSPYLLAEESVGRLRYGDDAGALDLIRTAWTHMIDNGPGTPWEEIGIDGRPVNARPGTSITNGELVDSAHAWSTAVLPLSKGVLGVSPVGDGYTTWSIAPDPVDLAWAQGVVPTPAGSISVRWRQQKDSFVLSVAVPQGTRGSISIPWSRGFTAIAMDGRIVWKNGRPSPDIAAHRDGERIVFDAVAGSHVFAAGT